MIHPEFNDVAALAELPVGTTRQVLLEGRKVAIYRTARGVFASDDRCPHRGGPLSEGDVMGNEIVCPWHLWSFDVETGENPAGPDCALVLHQVRIEGDRILVKLSPDAPTDPP
jgi:nitrite reductase (NADH) small subunit